MRSHTPHWIRSVNTYDDAVVSPAVKSGVQKTLFAGEQYEITIYIHSTTHLYIKNYLNCGGSNLIRVKKLLLIVLQIFQIYYYMRPLFYVDESKK